MGAPRCEDWHWQYDNRGLRLAQIRFYPILTPVDPGKVFRLDVKVPRDTAPGRYMEAVYLHTNHPTMSRLAVGVNVLVKNDLYVNPEGVDLGRMSIAIRSVDLQEPGMKVSFTPEGATYPNRFVPLIGPGLSFSRTRETSTRKA